MFAAVRRWIGKMRHRNGSVSKLSAALREQAQIAEAQRHILEKQHARKTGNLPADTVFRRHWEGDPT
jgi:hypothetical protein